MLGVLPVQLRRAAADSACGALTKSHDLKHFTKKQRSSNTYARSPSPSLQASSMHCLMLDTSPRYVKSPDIIPLLIVTLYWIVSGLHWLGDPGVENRYETQTRKTCAIRNTRGHARRMRGVIHTKKRTRKWLSRTQSNVLGYFYFQVKNEYDSKPPHASRAPSNFHYQVPRL